MRVSEIDEVIRSYAPDFRDAGDRFKEYLKKYITPKTRLLDIGCGRFTFGAEYYKVARERVGIDPDAENLRENALMDQKICASIEDLPDGAGMFDVVVAQWVFEHLENPEKAAEIIARHCVAGGCLLFVTSNLYSPVMLLSRIVPTAWKKFLKRVFLGIAERDTFQTYYRINTLSKIEAVLARAGFRRIALERVGAINYFAVSRSMLIGKIFWDRFFSRIRIFDFFQTHIVGVYGKVG